MPNLEIRKVLGMSLSHITELTAYMLEHEAYTNNLGLTVYPFQYGYWIFTGNLTLTNNKISYDKTPIGNLPPDLQKCIELAIKNDCQWLQFDSDGPEIDNLPTYE